MAKYFLVAVVTTFVLVICFHKPIRETGHFQKANHELQIGVWTPYWNQDTALPRLQELLPRLDSISPFVFELDADHYVYSRANLKNTGWQAILESARENNKEILPTITTHDPVAIHEISSTLEARDRHVDQLIEILDEYPEFSGLDIDYEEAATEDFVHLTVLYAQIAETLHARKKTMACSVGIWLPGDPAASYFSGSIPLEALEHCDRIRIMAYDQRRGFKAFNERHANELYVPVGDLEWIESTLQYTLKFIEPHKIELGIATYGYLYRVTDAGDETVYERQRYLTYDHFLELSETHGKTIERAGSGEAVFYYGDYIAISADATYVNRVTELAEKYDVYGTMLFSIDGREDETLLK